MVTTNDLVRPGVYLILIGHFAVRGCTELYLMFILASKGKTDIQTKR